MAWLIENWRDAILIVVGLLGVYMVFSVMRLVQLSRSSTRVDFSGLNRHDPIPDVLSETSSEPLWSDSDGATGEVAPTYGTVPLTDAAPEPSHEPAPTPSRLARFARWGQAAAALPHDALAPPPAPAAREDFANELRQSHLDAEIDQLRRESAMLRDELAQLHEELARMRATQNVSPMYSEAASLAQKGVSADGIAGQCGISLGEAELVAALALADGRGGRIEPTGYTDPNGFGGDDGSNGTGGKGNGGQPHRNRRTGTHD